MLRDAAGWSQLELAKRLDISRTYLSELESGKRDPSLSFLKRVGSLFSIPVSMLVMDEDEGSEETRRLIELTQNILAKMVASMVSERAYGRKSPRD